MNFACSIFPPFITGDQTDPGITPEILEAALTSVGRTSNFQNFPWKRAFKLTETGNADALCGCSYSADREDNFHFSDTLGVHSQGLFFTNEFEGEATGNLNKLKASRVATVRGYAIEKELEKNGITSIGVVDNSQLLKILLKQRVDAIYTYRDVIRFELKKQSLGTKLSYFELSSQPFYSCFSKKIPNSNALVQEFNRGLRIIKQNGTYSAIWEKYSPKN
ncbi:MAG: transporter substrate-binding domain-containing protein [Sneathiella sp.]